MLASSFSGSTLCRKAFAPVQSVRPAARTAVIECAQKKGGGSTRNGRDSKAKARGIKVYGGQPVKAGGIIVRQVGSTWHAGVNTMLGSDYTLFSTVTGIVQYDKRKERPVVHVYAHDDAKSIAFVAKTHTTKPADGVTSRAQRRLLAYAGKPRKSGNVPASLKVASLKVADVPA